MSALSEALKQANSRGLSTRAIAAEAERRGHRINYSTVSKYMNGTHGEPEEPTLQALAAALQVPLSVLRDAAGLPRDEGPFSLPAEAARLTRRQREAVLAVVGAFLDSGDEKEGDGDGNAAPKIPAGVSPAPDAVVTDADTPDEQPAGEASPPPTPERRGRGRRG